MDSNEATGAIISLVQSLARVCRSVIAGDPLALNLYAVKLKTFDLHLIRMTIETADWNKMPTPAELRLAVINFKTRTERGSAELLGPGYGYEEWVCPACHGHGWAQVYQDGATKARRCLVGGHHSLKDKAAELEAESKTDLVNWLMGQARRDPEEFDGWLHSLFGTTYLSHLSVQQLWKLRLAVGRGAVQTYTNTGEVHL